MAYIDDRVVYDADSHIMELPDWIEQFADADIRDRIRPLALGGAGKLAEHAVEQAAARRGDDAAAALLEEQLMSAKGWGALGAFDSTERSRALDLLGFQSQLVFSTFAPTQFLGSDEALAIGGTKAHNRAMAAFCADDQRMIAVAAVGWMGPETTLDLVTHALDEGCGTVMFPSHPGRGISPTHHDYYPVWDLLQERGIPFVTHIGGAGRAIKPAFHDNGRPVSDFLGGGENIRGKDYMALHQVPEQFYSALVLDGVLEDFPGLRGGCIEQGAMWVVPWIKRLDLCQEGFGKGEPTMANLPMKPSEYVHRQLWFTPFPKEPVGWMIEEAGDDLFLFSSDYPHPEGTRDPVKRFEDTMESIDEPARDKFYRSNYADMLALS